MHRRSRLPCVSLVFIIHSSEFSFLLPQAAHVDHCLSIAFPQKPHCYAHGYVHGAPLRLLPFTPLSRASIFCHAVEGSPLDQ